MELDTINMTILSSVMMDSITKAKNKAKVFLLYAMARLSKVPLKKMN